MRNGRDVNFTGVSRTAMPDARIIYNFNNGGEAWRHGASASLWPTLLAPPYVTTICLSNGVNESKNFQRNSPATPASSAVLTCARSDPLNIIIRRNLSLVREGPRIVIGIVETKE